MLDECDRASERGDTGALYRELRKLEKRGQKKAPMDSQLTKEEFKTHFEKVSHERFENPPEVLEEVVELTEDLRGTEKAEAWAEKLERNRIWRK